MPVKNVFPKFELFRLNLCNRISVATYIPGP